MRLGVRGKLFVFSVALIVVVGAGAGVYLEGRLRTSLEARIETELTNYAQGVRELVEQTDVKPEIGIVDPLADRLGRAFGVRVTLVDRSGRVLGDSALSATQVDVTPNHRDRPEVVTALTQGRGVARRYSVTVEADMLYVAVPYGNGAGVARAAMPLDEVDAAVARLRAGIALAGLLGLLVAVVIIALTSHIASRALRRLLEQARALVHPDHGTPPYEGDELGALEGSLNRIAVDIDRVVAKLTRERDRLYTILRGMTEGVLAIDGDDRITLANPAVLDLLQVEGDMVGRPLEDIPVRELVDLFVAARQGTPSDVEIDVGPHGRRRILARAAPLKTTEGAVIVTHDVTEMRRLERIRRDFVANVSHELRTPISVVRANAETLREGAMDDVEHGPRFLDGILRNADRLSEIIADLLELSRIEAGQVEVNPKPTLVAPVLARAAEAVETLAVEKSVAVDLQPDAGARALVDPRLLEQILVNLLDNAVKYTPDGGHVSANAKTRASRVRIEVRDDGPGIPPKYRERVFERFYRVDKGRSRQMGGTGLGLSIVRHLVETMGGRVGVEPNEPTGSVFYVDLPAAGPATDVAGGPAEAHATDDSPAVPVHH